MRYHNEKFERIGRDELCAIQSKVLVRTVHQAYSGNAVFRSKFDQAGVVSDDIRSIEDIHKLPFMNKADLRDHYPLGMCCRDKNELVEMHMSSGSTGVPVVMPYTRADLDQWAECMARCYIMAGANPGDPVQITPSFGLFNGGFGMYHGARAAGLFVIPTGAGNTQRQIKLAKDFGTRILTGVVSYGIRIMEVLAEKDETLDDLKVGIFGAEVFSDSMREKIDRGLGIESFDIYGMTETGGVGTLGMDCPAHDGIHVWEDHYLVEVLEPNSDKPVAEGQYGELVITSLTREALPAVRFRTGDLTRVISRDECSCGRTHVRIEAIRGRADDMLIVKGVNFFPRQVEQVLMTIPGVGSNYQIIIEETDGVRDCRINVEANRSVTGFMVEKALKEALGFSPKGDVYPLGGLPRQEGKARRVFFENNK